MQDVYSAATCIIHIVQDQNNSSLQSSGFIIQDEETVSLTYNRDVYAALT